jgi:hypothetical protein
MGPKKKKKRRHLKEKKKNPLTFFFLVLIIVVVVGSLVVPYIFMFFLLLFFFFFFSILLLFFVVPGISHGQKAPLLLHSRRYELKKRVTDPARKPFNTRALQETVVLSNRLVRPALTPPQGEGPQQLPCLHRADGFVD